MCLAPIENSHQLTMWIKLKVADIKTGEEQPAFCYTELCQSDSYFGYKYPIHMLPLQISSLTSCDVHYRHN